MVYNAVVVGAGPAGYVAAIRLAQLGLKTALVEKHYFGGECTNYGCIPTKAFIESANIFWKSKRGKDLGVLAEPKYSFQTFSFWKNKIVLQLRNGIRFLCEKNGVNIFEGDALLKSRNIVALKVNEHFSELETENVVVASGSVPMQLPNLPFDGKKIISSRDFFSLEELPESILIVGGGAIGVEFASALSKLDVKVILVEVMNQLLPGFDRDVSRYLLRSLSRLGVKVYTSALLSKASYTDGDVEAKISLPNGEEVIRVEKVLVAAGRRPSPIAGLKDAGVLLDSRDHILVDEFLRSNVPNIYAVGDVAGPPYLAHKAFKQGLVAAEVICGKNAKYNFRAVPNVIFSEPEVVSVGFCEDDARKNGFDVTVGRFPLHASGRALTEASPEGFVKIVVDKKDFRVIGIQMVGAKVSELAGEASLAVELGLDARKLASVMHPHPTISEALMEAAEDAVGKPIHFFKEKGRLGERF
ncbi:MAG: dihydrolipoyl dehydrogenase [Nitrososphaeria archaeon]|nr:dihydrolipoyl dehydrogenase [Nitrososphaeria archaeon]